jgi:hypothetical protein
VIRRGSLVISFIVVGFLPSVACAQWTQFLPTPFENGAFLDVYGSYERDNLHSGSHSSRWSDTFLKQTVTVYSIGYSYHPRFVQYQFSVSGALREEDYRATAVSSHGWQTGPGLEYDLSLVFLPEHPYNLQLFARRFEPLFKEQAATQHNLVQTSNGANFRYKNKPYFFHAGFLDDTIESPGSTTDITRAYVDGEYFKRYANGNEWSVNGAFNPSWFSSSQNLDGSSLQYVLGNYINLQRLRLTANVSNDSYEQKSPSSGKFTQDNLSSNDFLTIYLPYHLRAEALYRYQNNEGKISDRTATQHQDLSETSNDIQVNVIHKLYQSLDTTYTFLKNWRSSSTGDTSFLSNGITLNYVKTIPRGRFLAGVNAARGDTDSNGQTNIVNEPFQGTAVPGSFTLRQPNVDPQSILIFLKSPIPPFEVIRLEENVHYVVVPSLNTFEIRVFALPAEFVVPGTYDFEASYSLLSGNFELQTDAYGATTSVELLDRLVTPYLGYAAVRSRVLSGAFPGGPLDSTTYTAGVLLQREPLLLRGEYQDVQWQVSPYRSWRIELQYVSALNATTNAFASASYLNKYFPHGEFQTVTHPFTEEVISASGSIQKQLYARNLFVSGGGAYSHLQGLIDSDSYSLNGSLIWKIGKIELTLGATAYKTDSSGSNTVSTRRDHELVYLKFRRRLF